MLLGNAPQIEEMQQTGYIEDLPKGQRKHAIGSLDKRKKDTK